MASLSHPTYMQLPQQNVMVEPIHQQHIMRNDRHPFSTSDDNVITKQIQSTHAPDGRKVDVMPILHLCEDIFESSTVGTILESNNQAHMDALEERNNIVGFSKMLEALAYTINKISCEISCKCSGGGDAHAITLNLLNLLSSYSWDAKVVLTLAALAVNYGEFWLVAQIHQTNQLAKSIAILKHLPDILDHSELLRPKFDALRNLIKSMMDVTRCIVQFKALPPQYINPDTSAMSIAIAHTPVAVYWTIRSVVACASQIVSLIGFGHEYLASTTEAWELSSLGHKLSNIHGHLMKQFSVCNQHIEDNRHAEAYQTLVRIFETAHIDNLKILKALIYPKDDIMPLYDGSNKRRVTLEVLRRKNVLLLISDYEIPHEELSILEQMYRESRHKPIRIEGQYEVVWIPIMDKLTPWTEAKEGEFEAMRSLMPWFTVHHPSVIHQAVIRYIKEVWHFSKKPILVVLDPHGRVVCPNALHMMWIWGSLAFPFTSSREDALWKEETWRLELLMDGIDPIILNWIAEGRFICVYGGEDIEWIRKFTTTAKFVAEEARIPLELVYVGKSNPRERVRKNIATISLEKLGYCWQDLTSIWFFWVRLESMWYSKMQLGKTIENDPIMQEILTMLSFDGSEQGWALFSRGTAQMAKGKGETILSSLTQFDSWKVDVEEKGFLHAMNDHLRTLHTEHHCNRLVLPGTSRIPEAVVCTECGRTMEKFVMYRCCTD
ncbi:hypothetical protein MKX01_024033 [Papaver californicum]|nr:hypothetical protein MKX01_024033 [Papaver californicum]